MLQEGTTIDHSSSEAGHLSEEYMALEKLYRSKSKKMSKAQILYFMGFVDPQTKLLNKKALIDAARNPSDILHNLFKEAWNKDYAQEKYLLMQVSLLYKEVKVLYLTVIKHESKITTLSFPVKSTPLGSKDEIAALMPAFSKTGLAMGVKESEEIAKSEYQSLSNLRHCLLSARGNITSAINSNKFFPLTDIPLQDLLDLINIKLGLISEAIEVAVD
jgi:hypothetical protein